MQGITYFKIPMPDDVRDWLDKAAKKASRSRGSHVLALIRQEMEREHRARWERLTHKHNEA